LDEEDILPGQEWEVEISKAVKIVDVIIVFLSKEAVTKAGYIHKEIRFALDRAEEQPPSSIFLIPVRLDECNVPERLRKFHWADLFYHNGPLQLIRALKARAVVLDAAIPGEEQFLAVVLRASTKEDKPL
jgi:hypothetical protein